MKRWLLAASILLIYSAGSWAVAFCQIYFQGAVISEPNKAIAFNEIVLATSFTLFGIICLIRSLMGRKDG